MIFLNTVNKLIFVTVKCGAFFAVRIDFLNGFRATSSSK
jgi:hypothetical protein